MKNKKGQLGGLYQGVLTIAAVGILIALVMYIFLTFGNAVDTDNVAGTVTNETGHANTTGYTVTYATAENFANPVLTALWNRTSGASVPLTNATISSTGVVTNGTLANYDNLSISYTYTYTEESASSNATTTLTTQFVDFLPWLGIILLVLAAGIVLFFVIRSFSGSKRGA